MAFIDLIYQSGEFYESEPDFGVSEVISNTLFPIIVFVVGFYINHIYSQFQRKKELITFRNYYIDTIKSIKSAALNQSNEFEKLSEKLIQPDILTIQFKDAPDFSTDILWDASKDKLYESIIQLKKGNKIEMITHYNKIMFSLQDLRFIEKNITLIMEDLIQGLKKYNQSFNDCQRELLWNRDMYYHEISKASSSTKPIFFIQSEEILQKWSSYDNYRTQYMTYENLIKPLKSLCEKYPAENYSVIYMKQLTTMITIQENMVRFSKDYSETYKGYSEDIQKDIKSIDNSIVNLNNFKDKLW